MKQELEGPAIALSVMGPRALPFKSLPQKIAVLKPSSEPPNARSQPCPVTANDAEAVEHPLDASTVIVPPAPVENTVARLEVKVFNIPNVDPPPGAVQENVVTTPEEAVTP